MSRKNRKNKIIEFQKELNIVVQKGRKHLTIEKVINALKEEDGILLHAAENLGVSRVDLYKFIEDKNQIKEVIHHLREAMVDKAESQFMNKIENGEDWAVKYALSTLGKKRGYNESPQNNIVINQGEKQLIVIASSDNDIQKIDDGTIQNKSDKKTE